MSRTPSFRQNFRLGGDGVFQNCCWIGGIYEELYQVYIYQVYTIKILNVSLFGSLSCGGTRDYFIFQTYKISIIGLAYIDNDLANFFLHKLIYKTVPPQIPNLRVLTAKRKSTVKASSAFN